MAGRYLDVDPALAFQHALAASRKGGRLSRVREAVALTAYAAGEYADALRDFELASKLERQAALVDVVRRVRRRQHAVAQREVLQLERLQQRVGGRRGVS